jgi:hypothetical protein
VINEKQKQRLITNWGERADALACNAEVRLYDANGPWECYIYALNPDNDDEVMAIVNAETVETCTCSILELCSMYDSDGGSLRLDRCFRPRDAQTILKKLREGYVRD